MFSWSGTALVRDVTKEVVTLKSRFPHEVQVLGSCGLAQTLIENDLIDEYRLLIFPIILGTGAVPTSLTLVKSNTTSKGVVVSVYRRGGSLRTGSFALDLDVNFTQHYDKTELFKKPRRPLSALLGA